MNEQDIKRAQDILAHCRSRRGMHWASGFVGVTVVRLDKFVGGRDSRDQPIARYPGDPTALTELEIQSVLDNETAIRV